MRADILIPSAVVALVALAACQKAPTAGATQAGASSGPTPAAATTLPHRRSGLWQQTISRDGKSGAMGAMKICIDEALETKASGLGQDLLNHGKAGAACGQHQVSRALDGSFSFSSTCKLGDGGTVVTKGVATGDFSADYHVHLESDIHGAPMAQMNGHHATDLDARWLGPCPSGMAGGDVELANGMRLDTHKLAGAAKALGATTGQ